MIHLVLLGNLSLKLILGMALSALFVDEVELNINIEKSAMPTPGEVRVTYAFSLELAVDDGTSQSSTVKDTKSS